MFTWRFPSPYKRSPLFEVMAAGTQRIKIFYHYSHVLEVGVQCAYIQSSRWELAKAVAVFGEYANLHLLSRWEAQLSGEYVVAQRGFGESQVAFGVVWRMLGYG